jgi:hypothetical protein
MSNRYLMNFADRLFILKLQSVDEIDFRQKFDIAWLVLLPTNRITEFCCGCLTFLYFLCDVRKASPTGESRVKLDSPGAILCQQERVGQDEARFSVSPFALGAFANGQ